MNDLEKMVQKHNEILADRERVLFDIYYIVLEAEKGDENDKQMALIQIKKLLKENGIYMPF